MEKKYIEKRIVPTNKDGFFVKLISTLRIFRFIDAAVFTGVPLMGIIVSIYHLHILHINLLSTFLYISIIYLLAIHVFSINDWADYNKDINDLNKRKESTQKKKITLKQYLLTAIITGIIPLCLLLTFSITKFIIGFALVLLSLIYSTNLLSLHGKSIPAFASLLHILGGMLAFLLGYLYFGNFNIDAVLTGSMFGIFLSAGHIFQEIRDFKEDRKNNIMTIANKFGKKTSALIGFSLMFCAHIIFQYIIDRQFLPDFSIYNWITFALVAVFIGFAIIKGLTYHSIKQLRLRYRIIYSLFGLYILSKIIIHI